MKTFPATIKTDIKINTLHHAMPSALEKTRIDVSVAFSELLFAAVVLLIFGVSGEVHFDLTRLKAYGFTNKGGNKSPILSSVKDSKLIYIVFPLYGAGPINNKR